MSGSKWWLLGAKASRCLREGGREARAEVGQGPHRHISEALIVLTRLASRSGFNWGGRTSKKVQRKKRDQHKGHNKGFVARSCG